MSMGKRQIAVRVSEELLERIEVARGRLPRERWLRQVVEAALDAALDEVPSGAAFDRFVAASREAWDEPGSGVLDRLEATDRFGTGHRMVVEPSSARDLAARAASSVEARPFRPVPKGGG